MLHHQTPIITRQTALTAGFVGYMRKKMEKEIDFEFQNVGFVDIFYLGGNTMRTHQWRTRKGAFAVVIRL
jgi:hypothetical protein